MANSKGTLKYRKVQRTPQNGENAGKNLWYATAVSDREMDFESFVTHISEHGSPYSRRALKKMPILGKINKNAVSFYACEQFSDIQIPSLF